MEEPLRNGSVSSTGAVDRELVSSGRSGTILAKKAASKSAACRTAALVTATGAHAEAWGDVWVVKIVASTAAATS